MAPRSRGSETIPIVARSSFFGDDEDVVEIEEVTEMEREGGRSLIKSEQRSGCKSFKRDDGVESFAGGGARSTEGNSSNPARSPFDHVEIQTREYESIITQTERLRLT